MLNSVSERTPLWGMPILIDVVWMCGCVGFAFLDVVCKERYDCAWNVGL